MLEKERGHFLQHQNFYNREKVHINLLSKIPALLRKYFFLTNGRAGYVFIGYFSIIASVEDTKISEKEVYKTNKQFPTSPNKLFKCDL